MKGKGGWERQNIPWQAEVHTLVFETEVNENISSKLHTQSLSPGDLILGGGAKRTLGELDNARPLAQCKIKAPKGEEIGSGGNLISTLPSALFTGTNSTHQLGHHQALSSPPPSSLSMDPAAPC